MTATPQEPVPAPVGGEATGEYAAVEAAIAEAQRLERAGVKAGAAVPSVICAYLAALSTSPAEVAVKDAVDWASEPTFDWNNQDGGARQRHVARHQQWAEDQINRLKYKGGSKTP